MTKYLNYVLKFGPKKQKNINPYEQDFQKIDVTMKKLEKISDDLKEVVGKGNDDPIYKIKSTDAIIFSTKIQTDMNKVLIDVMSKVNNVVKASDYKAKWIAVLTIALMILTAATLWVTVEMIRNDDNYKREIKTQTHIIADHAKIIDSVLSNMKNNSIDSNYIIENKETKCFLKENKVV